MMVIRSKIHNFVGMDLDFKDDDTVGILTKDYIKDCIEVFGDNMSTVVNIPGKHDLFTVIDEKTMSEERMDIFHHIVAKLLYVSKIARVDIDLTVSFLYTKVLKSTEEDWVKLRSLLHYLFGTLDMERIIGANDLDLIIIYVDASYTVHYDMRGHTGILVTSRRGIIQGKASKQKLKTKSST